MSSDKFDITAQALDWIDKGRRIALASVVQTWGSAPQPVGAQLLIDDEGRFSGSVSGGCVEAAVIVEAEDVIATGKPQLMTFGVANETAWEAGLACGGTIKVFVESIGDVKAGLLRQIVKYKKGRVPVAQVTDLVTGSARLVTGPQAGEDELSGELADGFRFDKSSIVGGDEGVFVSIFNPALKLIIIGAVHIAQHIVPLAKMLGYDVSVIDPRGSFATPERFDGVQLIAEWPDEVLDGFDLDARTAFVALTHDPKIDDPALRMALAADCFYIGALGSRQTHAARLERLADVAGTDRIDGPIGLDIGARGTAEIAVSIVAKMTSALRQGR